MSIFETQPGGRGERYPVKFRFKKPAQLNIRKKDGSIVLIEYVTGDTISVIQYPFQYCITGEPISEVELEDGSFLQNNNQKLDLEYIGK